MTSDPILFALVALTGLLIGSFLNVVVYRLPVHDSVVGGRSRCRQCKKVIRWFDNIPLLSFIMLRGRCRHCRAAIAKQYPFVELISALLAVAIVYRYGFTLKGAWIFAFAAVMLVITLIDWHHKIIPDELSIGGTVLGWVGALVCLDLTLVESIVGSLAGGGLILVIALVYKAVRKVDGMGGGDVKLMAMIGAFMGWKMIFPVLFFASLLGSVYGIYLIRKGGTSKTAVAFGSFLAPSAALVFALGARIWQLYLGR